MIVTHARPAASGEGRLGLAALAFIGAGGAKLAGAAVMVELFSRDAFSAAVLLAMVVAGAFVAHVTVLGSSPAAPVVLFVLTAIIAYLRKP
jgi:hypothetical protein